MTHLVDYIEAHRDRPLKPGVHDCALFVARWVEEKTGANHAAPFEGYDTFEEGKARLAAAGYSEPIEYLECHLQEVPPSFANVGDVAVLEAGEWGICAGDLIAVVHRHGVGMVPRSRMVRAFRYG